MTDHIPSTNELELQRFRDRWRRELKERQAGSTSYGSSSTSAASPADGFPEEGEGKIGGSLGSETGKGKEKEISSARPRRRSSIDFERLAIHDYQSPSPLAPPSQSARRILPSGRGLPVAQRSSPSPSLDEGSQPSPVAYYAFAVASERSGMMDDALQAYRKAFRMAPDVDKQYHRLTKDEIDGLEMLGLEGGRGVGGSREGRAWEFRFSRTMQTEADYRPEKPEGAGGEGKEHQSSTEKLRRELVESFEANPFLPTKPGAQPTTDPSPQSKPSEGLSPYQLHPSDPSQPLRLSRLPPELLTHILISSSTLSPQTIAVVSENFARTCRAARLLTLDNALWRQICERAYEWEAMRDTGGRGMRWVEKVCSRWHGGDWRRMYIEQPRVRTDGCFIAVMTYLRRGESAGFYDQTHFVTYFRFLRFASNGTCLSLLTTEPPSSIVRRLDGSLRMKGLTRGRWRLEGERVTCYALEDISGEDTLERPAARNEKAKRTAEARAAKETEKDVETETAEGGAVGGKYRFVMESRLRSTRRGMMNKLEILSLATEHKLTGEVTEVPLKHQKPFFFSRVLPYES